jgi:hypothetical protein
MGEMRIRKNFSLENLKGGGHFEDLSVDVEEIGCDGED